MKGVPDSTDGFLQTKGCDGNYWLVFLEQKNFLLFI